jgi:hypothetical protein
MNKVYHGSVASLPLFPRKPEFRCQHVLDVLDMISGGDIGVRRSDRVEPYIGRSERDPFVYLRVPLPLPASGEPLVVYND